MSWTYRVVFTMLLLLLLNYLFLGLYARVVLVLSILLLIQWWRNRGLSSWPAASSYGVSRKVVTHVSGEKKVYNVYPFCPSSLDFQRKFEDELAVFLYLLGERFAEPRLDRLDDGDRVKFLHDDGSKERYYSLDFRWLLKHFALNSSKYALLLTSTPNHQKELKKRHGKIQHRGPANLMAELNKWQESIHINTIASFSDFLGTTCTRLCKLSDSIAHNSYLEDAVENGCTRGSVQSRKAVSDFMQDAITLARIITVLTKPRDLEELDDHYQMMVNIKDSFEQEFLPWIHLVQKNDDAFSKMSASKKQEFIKTGLERMASMQGEKSREVMAVTVFSQFGIECT